MLVFQVVLSFLRYVIFVRTRVPFGTVSVHVYTWCWCCPTHGEYFRRRGGKAFTDVSVEPELVSSYTVVRCNWNEGRGEEHTVESTLTDSPQVSGGRSGPGIGVYP